MNQNLAAQTAVYLKTRVMTARPEELRLMLFDGAIKFCRQARHAMPLKDFDSSFTALTKAKNILLELQTSLNPKADSDLCGKLSSLYNYMYLRLVDANIERDETAIDEVIGLLEFERETWGMVIKKLEQERQGESPTPVAPSETQVRGHAAAVAPTYSQRNPIAKLGPAQNASGQPTSRFIVDG